MPHRSRVRERQRDLRQRDHHHYCPHLQRCQRRHLEHLRQRHFRQRNRALHRVHPRQHRQNRRHGHVEIHNQRPHRHLLARDGDRASHRAPTTHRNQRHPHRVRHHSGRQQRCFHPHHRQHAGGFGGRQCSDLPRHPSQRQRWLLSTRQPLHRYPQHQRVRPCAQPRHRLLQHSDTQFAGKRPASRHCCHPQRV